MPREEQTGSFIQSIPFTDLRDGVSRKVTTTLLRNLTKSDKTCPECD